MSLEKATLTNCVTLDKIPVMFNPEEYTVNKDINYAQTSIPGLSGPILQFVNGNMQTLEMELLLDTYEEHREGSRVLNQAGEDVRNLTRKITDLMVIDPEIHAPPVLIFAWGSFSFTCVLARASQRFIMFKPDGIPVRARLNVTFNEYIDPEREAKEISRQTADYTKLHTVVEGETLSSIAADAYGNPRMWRPIALDNNIDEPRNLSIGQRLRIPPLPFMDPDSGEIVS
jgi:nucleoid-associated protein YgaU